MVLIDKVTHTRHPGNLSNSAKSYSTGPSGSLPLPTCGPFPRPGDPRHPSPSRNVLCPRETVSVCLYLSTRAHTHGFKRNQTSPRCEPGLRLEGPGHPRPGFHFGRRTPGGAGECFGGFWPRGLFPLSGLRVRLWASRAPTLSQPRDLCVSLLSSKALTSPSARLAW